MSTYAVVGAGGIGGLIGCFLANAGHDVTFVVRASALDTIPRRFTLVSDAVGTVEVPVTLVASLEQPVDCVWIATKSFDLDSALESVNADLVGGRVVIPLLNGWDHMARLRARYGESNVVAATVRAHSERIAPGRFVHHGWHAKEGEPALALASTGATRERVEAVWRDLIEAGVPSEIVTDETTLLWDKLIDLSTMGLASVVAGSMGAARMDPEINDLRVRAVDEVFAVASALGASLDKGVVLGRHEEIAAAATSSLQRDLEAGSPIELDAIAGPPIREGHRLDLDMSATEELTQRIAEARRARMSGG